ncbi:hypothetical protein LTR66_009330 [Elasticomyces elasticus]|nr:hypothetical protein LTR66_009330 [Elasticomyces elasticus]
MAQEFLATPKEPVPLHIPDGSTVKVSIIDGTSRFVLPMFPFLSPEIEGKNKLTGPTYSFLIEHSSGKKILFDLGVRKDWENYAPKIVSAIRENGWQVSAEKDVACILQENGVDLKSIHAVVWSHQHWDHIGDMTTFPTNTDVVVGPGFKDTYLPAYPTSKDSVLLESDLANRNLREIDFAKEGNGLRLGRFNAVDYFGDGSFYLIDTPGHTVGHLCGLVRTTNDPSTFIFMGADAAHHGGEFRPTEYLPLPTNIDPSPIPRFHSGGCPGHLIVTAHPYKSATRPFYDCTEALNHNVEQAEWTISGLREFDAHENVFMVISHDETLLNVLGFYPQYDANDWKKRNWRNLGRWRFLADFEAAIQEKQ